jgi:cysteine-rich repeat protein
MRNFATLGSAALIGWACGGSYFTCAEDAQCVHNGVQGACIAAAEVCAFPDQTCPSGLRFGDQGPPGTPTGCVPPEQPSGSSDDSSGTTQTSDSGSSEVDGGSINDGSSTGREPAVCGDGMVQGDEPCDDGDREDGDGCDEGCVLSGSARWLLVIGDPGAAPDRGRDLVLAGDVLHAIGTASGDVVVHSVSLAGALESTWSFDAPMGGTDTGNGMALRPDGTLALGGTVTADEVRTWMAVWDPATAEIVWQLEGPIGELQRVAVGADGSVYAAGSDLSAVPGVAWIGSSLDGTPGATLSDLASTRADAISVGASARVLVGGSMGELHTGPFVVWEFSGTALLPLFSEAGRFGTGGAQAVVEADDGDVVVGGWVTTANERDVLLLRLMPDGTERWRYTYSSGLPARSDEIEGLALSPEGDVIATGFRTADTGGDLWVARFTAEGEQRWVHTYDHQGGFDVGRAVVLGPDGDLYVVGELEATSDGVLGSDMFVARLAP